MLFENRQTFITVMKLLSVHFLAEIQTASLSRPRRRSYKLSNNQLRRTPLRCTVAAEPRLTRGSRGMLPRENLKPGSTISCNLSDVFPTQISVLNMHGR